MWSFLERAKKVIFALVLSIVPLVLLYAQSKDEELRSFLAKPAIECAGYIERAALNISGFVSDSLFRYVFLVGRTDELMELRAQVLKTEAMSARVKDLVNEKSLITELYLKTLETNVIEREYARVIARAGAPMARMIRLNRGSVHGIQPKSPVIAHEGVVGQVLSVAPHFCDVLLVTDASSAINVKIIGSNARGLLRGITNNKEYLMEVRDIDGLASVNDGDIVVTSGVNTLFPSGVPVGKIIRSSRSDDGLFVQAMIKPFVSMDSLDHVVVLLEEPTSSAKAKSLSAAWPLGAP